MDAVLEDLRLNNWRIELPGGEWVKFRDPATITENERQPLKRMAVMVELLGQRIDAAAAAGHAAVVEMMLNRQADLMCSSDQQGIAVFIEAWSYELPVPKPGDIASLGQLRGPVVDRLYGLAKSLMSAMFVNLDVTPPSVDSPFPASNGSMQH